MPLTQDITPDIEKELPGVAAKVFWWGTPDEAIRDVPRLVAQVMVFGDWEDVRKTRRLLGDRAFESVLDNPPPGVFDRKSWNYWHLYFGRHPVPPLPQRVI